MLVSPLLAPQRVPRQLNSCDFPLSALHLRKQIPDNWVISQGPRQQKVSVLEDVLNCTDTVNIKIDNNNSKKFL